MIKIRIHNSKIQYVTTNGQSIDYNDYSSYLRKSLSYSKLMRIVQGAILVFTYLIGSIFSAGVIGLAVGGILVFILELRTYKALNLKAMYELSADEQSKYFDFAQNLSSFCESETNIWEVISEPKRNKYSDSVIGGYFVLKEKLKIGQYALSQIGLSNVPILENRKSRIIFLPDCIVVRRRNKTSVYPYVETKGYCSSGNYAEEQSKVTENDKYTWKYTHESGKGKIGSKIYSDNKKILLDQYLRFEIRNSSQESTILLLSNNESIGRLQSLFLRITL